jgi:SAM-dependent methyltransferase
MVTVLSNFVHWTTRDKVPYTLLANSEVLHGIKRDAYGTVYVAEADPRSPATIPELDFLATNIRVAPGNLVIVLGSGTGLSSRWVARKTGSAVVGIDISPEAVDIAVRSAAESGLSERLGFLVGDFASSGLPSRMFDGAVSLDAIYLTPDITVVLREASRLLRPSAYLVFTGFLFSKPTLALHGIDPIVSYEPLLEAAGFAMVSCEEPEDWKSNHRAFFGGIIAASDSLTQEVGARVASIIIEWASRRLAEIDDGGRRVLIVAQRRGYSHRRYCLAYPVLRSRGTPARR